MPELVFYDESGRAVAYTEDGEHIFGYSGVPLAYVEGDSVYSYSGAHLGWYLDGWIRDHAGACVYFTEAATGGPIKPMRAVKPVKGVKSILPIRGIKAIKPLRPLNQFDWSLVLKFGE